MQASSLPVVIISNSSQQQSAWASILWFNMISVDTKARDGHRKPFRIFFSQLLLTTTAYVLTRLCFSQDIRFFANCPVAFWPQFGEMLSWQFLSATKRGLDDSQLEMIAQRIFGKCHLT